MTERDQLAGQGERYSPLCAARLHTNGSVFTLDDLEHAARDDAHRQQEEAPSAPAPARQGRPREKDQRVPEKGLQRVAAGGGGEGKVVTRQLWPPSDDLKMPDSGPPLIRAATVRRRWCFAA